MERKHHVENEFEHEGFKCAVVMQAMGHRCGYVGLVEGHPLYGCGYSDDCRALKTSPECYFDVHGGITYAGGGKGSKYPVESDLWWFGFDCAHYGDGKDLDAALRYGVIDQKTYDRLTEIDNMFMSEKEETRSQEYVEESCRSLAAQLKALEAKNENA